MPMEFKLPDLGEGIHEGEILSVSVSVGDSIKEGDIILTVETDKAAVEIPSPFTGMVAEIRVTPGQIVKVGEVMMIFSERKEEVKEEAGQSVPRPANAKAASGRGPVPASPATRRLARELGVNLLEVTGKGPEGLVTAEDVRSAADFPERKEKKKMPSEKTEETPRPIFSDVPPLPDFSKWGAVNRVPVRSIRRATARQMSLAWSQIPHVTNQDWVDITDLEAFRQKHKATIEEKGGKLTLITFAIKAAAAALKTYPHFNASMDAEAGEMIIKRYYHIGIAVDTDDGLIVPVLRDVDRKSITDIAVELGDLVGRTRKRKTTLEELQGGTFTITNVGGRGGGGHFSPIINYPEVAILGMGKARLQPVVKPRENGGHEITSRLMLPIVLCFDHRAVDGADAIRFMQVMIDTLEDPEKLFMTMT